MSARPPVKMTSRAERDLASCLRFIRDQPWGNARRRERDIRGEMRRIRDAPEQRRVEVYRRGSGVGLRRRSVAQFVIIYAYFAPKRWLPRGLISIRAIRHRRVRDVFLGVRDSVSPPPPYGDTSGGGTVISGARYQT